MPTHKIHLTIAKRINEKLNLDLDCVMLGSVLPDVGGQRKHSISHFQSGETDLEGLANPDIFVNKYKEQLSNPVMIGYLIHLLTDRFYNEYVFKNYYLYDESNNGIGVILKGKKVTADNQERKRYKHSDFFTYDAWLTNKGHAPKFKNNECISKIIPIEEIIVDENKLNEYIKSSNKDIDSINIFSKFKIYNYKMLDQQTLDKMLDECISYIFDYLNTNVN